MNTVALFIDADNISAQYAHDIINTAQNYGTLTLKRVYTNWTKSVAHTWKDECITHGLTTIQQFDHLSGKNSSDMAISVDVIESLFTKQIDVFCLATSDSDFTPICIKLQEYGKTVIGIGNKNASKSLINACHEFHYLTKDEIAPPPIAIKAVCLHKKHHPNPNNDQQLIATITQMIKTHGEQGRLNTAKLGQVLRQQNPSFTPNFYGYDKIGELFKVMNDFEITIIGSTHFISLRKNKTTSQPYQNHTPTTNIQSANTADALLKDTVLTNALSNAIALHQNTYGWATLSDVERYVHDTFGILSANYGYNNMTELLKNLSTLFYLQKKAGSYYIQDKRTSINQKTTTPNTRVSTDILQKDEHLIQVLRQGIQAHTNKHGWAKCADVGKFVRENHISTQNYGYRNLTELIKALDIFDIKIDNNMHLLKDPMAKVISPSHPLENKNLENENLSPVNHEVTDELLSLLSNIDDNGDDLSDAIKHTINALSPNGDWVRASSVSDYLRRHYGVKVSDLGFATFAELYANLDGIQCQKQGRILLIKTI